MFRMTMFFLCLSFSIGIVVCKQAMAQAKYSDKDQGIRAYVELSDVFVKQHLRQKRKLFLQLGRGKGLPEELMVLEEQLQSLKKIVAPLNEMVKSESEKLSTAKGSRNEGKITNEEYESIKASARLALDSSAEEYFGLIERELLPHQLKLFDKIASQFAIRGLARRPHPIELPCVLGKHLGLPSERFRRLAIETIETRESLSKKLAETAEEFRNVEIEFLRDFKSKLPVELKASLSEAVPAGQIEDLENRILQLRTIGSHSAGNEVLDEKQIHRRAMQIPAAINEYKFEAFRTSNGEFPLFSFSEAGDEVQDLQDAQITTATDIYEQASELLEAEAADIQAKYDDGKMLKETYDQFVVEYPSKAMRLRNTFVLLCEEALLPRQILELQTAATNKAIGISMDSMIPSVKNPFVAYVFLAAALGQSKPELLKLAQLVHEFGDERKSRENEFRKLANEANAEAVASVLGVFTSDEREKFEELLSNKILNLLNDVAFQEKN
jgi:hypothetical protein